MNVQIMTARQALSDIKPSALRDHPQRRWEQGLPKRRDIAGTGEGRRDGQGRNAMRHAQTQAAVRRQGGEPGPRHWQDGQPMRSARADMVDVPAGAPGVGARTLANAMPQIVWVADAEGRVLFINTSATAYAQSPAARLAHDASGYPAQVHPDDVARTSLAWQAALRAGEPYEVEHRVLAPDGEYRWMRSRAVPEHGADGQVTQWVGTSIDVHDLKRAGERLDEATRQRRQFLSILAHELRNPLAPIRTGLATLRLALDQGALDRVLVDRLRALMERHTLHLTRLIDTVLEVEQIDRGYIWIERETVNLAAIVNQAAEAARAQLDAAGHSLQIDLAAAPATVEADPMRLVQVLTNLLSNAAKYTPHGGHIELAARRLGDQLVIRVRDDGVGMPADLVPRVFDLFLHPAPGPGVNARHGLGIGLTLVKRLIELHGGSVSAASDGPGRGSEFRIALPMAADSADAASRTRGRGNGADDGPAAKRVLIADDNEDAGETLAMMLRMLGHEVRTATNGMDAISEGEAFQPALICPDLGMPVLDGLGAARAMRQQPWGKRALLVAMTGYGQDEDRRKTQEAGFDVHLVKPVDPMEIIRLLESLDRR
jgi:PAS domain S-box-containing protein